MLTTILSKRERYWKLQWYFGKANETLNDQTTENYGHELAHKKLIFSKQEMNHCMEMNIEKTTCKSDLSDTVSDKSNAKERHANSVPEQPNSPEFIIN